MSDQVPDQEDYSRDLTLGESFTRSFNLARKNYLRLLPIFGGFGVLVAMVSTYITYVTPTYNLPSDVSSLSQAQLLEVAGSVFRYLEYVGANFLVTWFILYFAAGIGVWKIWQIKSGSPKAVPGSENRINYLNLAFTAFLSVIIIEVSFILIVGPLVFGTLLYLGISASAIENKSPLSSFGRSRKLISGKWVKTFLLVIGIQIVVYLGALLISSLFGLLPLSNATSMLVVNAVQNLVLALEFPLVSASMVVLYSSYSQSQVRSIQRPPSLYDNMTPQPMGYFGQVTPQRNNFCPSCGTSVATDERFCRNCGRAISSP